MEYLDIKGNINYLVKNSETFFIFSDENAFIGKKRPVIR